MDLRTVVVDARGDIRVAAGGSRGRPDVAAPTQFADGSPHLGRDAVQWLLGGGVALVGIVALNVDDVNDIARRLTPICWALGVPIISTWRTLRSCRRRERG